MGAWGVNLYQDDVTLDIKEEYINLLKVGMRSKEATENLINNYSDVIEDEEEGPIFGFALAETQWTYGRLLPEVKNKAIEYIDSGIDLKRWEKDEKQLKQRHNILMKLKEKLNSEQPPEKKISKLTLQKSNWEIGDILLYQILNEQLKEHKWYKKYILLKVVEINKSSIGNLPTDIYYHEHSRISLYNWIGCEPPKVEKIKELKFVVLKNDYEPWYEQEFEIGQREKTTGIIDFTKRELKRLNIQVIFKEVTNNQEVLDITNIKGIWYNIYNFDNAIVRALEIEEKKNNLIDETR